MNNKYILYLALWLYRDLLKYRPCAPSRRDMEQLCPLFSCLVESSVKLSLIFYSRLMLNEKCDEGFYELAAKCFREYVRHEGFYTTPEEVQQNERKINTLADMSITYANLFFKLAPNFLPPDEPIEPLLDLYDDKF